MHNDKTIEDQIAKHLSGEATPEEAMEIELWRGESLANQNFFDACARLFKLSDTEFDGSEKARIWNSIKVESGIQLSLASKRNKSWWIGIAASLLVLTVAGWLLNTGNQKQQEPGVYETASAARQVRLTDGTEINLSAGSSLVTGIDYGRTIRNIALKGSASFSVPHDSSKPFVVNIGKLHIKDLGTRFTVTAVPNSEEIHITVEEGSVLVYDNKGRAITLFAGESTRYNSATENMVVFPGKRPDSITKTIRDTVHGQAMGSLITINQSEQPAGLDNNDTAILVGLSESDVEKILGQAVKLVAKNQDKTDGLVKYHRQYSAVSDGTVNLYSDIESYPSEAASHQAYVSIRKRIPTGEDLSNLKTGTEAFKFSDGINFCQLLVRSRNTLIRVKIGRLKKGVSTETLISTVIQISDRAR